MEFKWSQLGTKLSNIERLGLSPAWASSRISNIERQGLGLVGRLGCAVG